MSEPTRISRRRAMAGMAGFSATAVMSSKLKAQYAFQSRPAPQWAISEWINQDGGNIDTLKGKVIVIDFFQLWCPGCNHFSGPLMTQWQKKYSREIAAGSLHMVKIHTVFEGHNYQTVKRLKQYVKEKGITLPVGVDKHEPGDRLPITMKRYQTRGTPEMAIIDKEGMIQFQQFGSFEPGAVEPMLEELIKRASA